MADFKQTGPFSRQSAEYVERLPGQIWGLLQGVGRNIGRTGKYLASPKAAEDYTRLLSGQLPVGGRPAAARLLMPGLPADYKETELAAGLAAQKFRYGAGLPGQQTLVFGVDGAGNVDRSQSDEYKSQMAQYRNLISQKKEQEAEDLGMKIWMEKYGGKLGLTGPNPLMQETADAPSGFGTFVPTQGATPALLQASEAPMKAFGEEVKTYFPGAGPEGFSPLDAQDQQQEATALQADMATTAGLSAGDRARNLTRAFRLGMI